MEWGNSVGLNTRSGSENCCPIPGNGIHHNLQLQKGLLDAILKVRKTLKPWKFEYT